MNWNKPILTDSGGYQIMSLSNLNKIDKMMANLNISPNKASKYGFN